MKKSIVFSNPLLEYRMEIFGLATLMIIYHHLGNRGIPGISVLPEFVQNLLKFVTLKASLGVDAFVFLSAIGLYYSMQRNSVGKFYTNRLKRVYMSWLVIMAPVLIITDFVIKKEGIFAFLLDMTTLRYWVDNPNTNTPWFVPFIIMLYLIFPLIHYLDKKTKHYSTIILFVFFVSLVFVIHYFSFEYFLSPLCRIPVFLFGILAAVYFEKNNTLSKRSALISCILLLSVYVLWYFVDLGQGLDFLVGSFVAVCLVIVYSYTRKHININLLTKLFVLFGTVSLEVYLIHTVMLRIIDANEIPDILFASMYVLIPVVSLLLSKLVSIITYRINGIFEKS